MIDRLAEWGSFDVQRSWLHAQSNNNVSLLRYEDLARDEAGFLVSLLELLEIDLPQDELDGLYRRTCYRKKAEGRSQGAENIRSHYRRGVAGDWRNYFDESIAGHFRARTGGLVEELGYEA